MLTVAMSLLTFKSRRASRLIEGEPLILVQEGKPVERNLKAERLDLDDLAEEARTNGIESLDDVKWCVLETGGTISFVKRSG